MTVRRIKVKAKLKAKSKGQALVETALMSLFLALLLAGAIDFGRAYYIGTVVENMAGEGAAYGAKFPERDVASPSCAQTVNADNNIQDRARQVAVDRGMVIRRPTQADVTVEPASCVVRCAGQPLKVTVTYTINDLFLPHLLGMNSITIRKSATQIILDNGQGTSCN